MSISAESVKQLREETGVSIGKCKQALEEANGDMDKAREVLKSYQEKAAAKKADRELGAGMVASYVHGNGQMGSLVALQCETDFVAKNEDFVKLANDIAMHVTAMGNDDMESLLEESFIKNPEQTIQGLVDAHIQKLGERIVLANVVRITAKA